MLGLLEMCEKVLNDLNLAYRNVVVPCVCCSGHPFPPDPDCQYCQGTGKIMYGIADVEVV
jgi:hypothetical protein